MRPMSWKAFFQSKLFFVVGIVLLGLLSTNLTRTQLKDRGIRREIAKLQAEVDALEQERTGYETLIALLETPAFLEKEARRTLGYAKPGEQVVVVEKSEREQQDQRDQRELSNPKKWWVYFFGG